LNSHLSVNQASPPTLLIVDDEPANLAILAQVLQPHYRVRAANSGERALQAVQSAPRPDLILLDVMMPDLDGYAVVAKLRANPDTRDIPVIFVTALSDEINEEHGFDLGAVDYIAKPIKAVIVLARVRAQLELKQARDWLADQNTWLEAEVARRMEEILTIQNVSILALAQLAETRDPETGNHIRRTQEYVERLAWRLREHPRFKDTLNEHFIQKLAKSAPLHDIGKVGVPDAILLKPGKLTPEEIAVMRTHARLGAEAIEKAVRDIGKPVDFLNLAMEIAHWHHEKWDGSGYPDGLAGEAIPVSARLMAIADVFDALVSARVYKAPMSLDAAREIIGIGCGSHFDPDIAEAFLAGFDEFAAIAQRYRDNP
jgi:putative two-component system response regulator